MANISIIDTGYITATSISGTQASTIVNSANSIELKGVNVGFSRASNVDSSEIINSNNSPVVGFGTVQAGKITVNGILDSKDDTDMNLMDDLNDLLKTYGVKLLYYNSTTDGYRDITDSLGDKNKDDIHKANNFSNVATPHLHVRVISFSISQDSNSYLRYSLEMVETE